MLAAVAPDGVYLDYALAPFTAYLERPEVTDIYVNHPQELWVETVQGYTERHEVPSMTAQWLERLSTQVAALSHQGISRESPLLSATLPGGARIQIIAPPATRGPIAIAIRQHLPLGLGIADYEATAAFDSVDRFDPHEIDGDLAKAKVERRYGDLLRIAIHARRNILVSGGTSTGKTTFLSALLREIPVDERLVLIEDTPELTTPHKNLVGLVAARSALGEATCTAEDLLNASLRLRPDRIILGELRGPEAFTFLRAVNTGHPGSMTTIHADSTDGAVEQLALLVLHTGTQLSRSDIVHYVRSTVDVYVQLGRSGGRRFVSAIELKCRHG